MPICVHLSVTACLFLFSRYFQAGGSPENVIQLLSENYTAVAQTVNLLAEWLIQTGAVWGWGPGPSPNTVQSRWVIIMLIHWKGLLCLPGSFCLFVFLVFNTSVSKK